VYGPLYCQPGIWILHIIPDRSGTFESGSTLKVQDLECQSGKLINNAPDNRIISYIDNREIIKKSLF
jgi:hypothetical protein